MTKSELIDALAAKQSHLAFNDVESAVKVMLVHMIQTLTSGERIEIRGFGTFNLRYQPSRTARNPKTGEAVVLPAKHKVHFKPGKELKDRVDRSATRGSAV